MQQTESGTQDVEAPTITDSPALSESGTDGAWTAGETVDVTLTFSEAVTLDTTGGTPSVGLSLGATEARSAPLSAGERHDGARLRLHAHRCGRLAHVAARPN